MSTALKALLALSLFTLFAACQQEEPMEEPMVMEEPTMEKF